MKIILVVTFAVEPGLSHIWLVVYVRVMVFLFGSSLGMTSWVIYPMDFEKERY